MKLLSRSEEIVLLAILKLQNNAYGVTIRDQASKITGHEWTFGAIYVPLDKLTQRGYVRKFMSQPTAERGGRSKCLYQINREGMKALKRIQEVHARAWQNIPGAILDKDFR
jgi:DNA-binding PadR family transcriptional regulator